MAVCVRSATPAAEPLQLTSAPAWWLARSSTGSRQPTRPPSDEFWLCGAAPLARSASGKPRERKTPRAHSTSAALTPPPGGSSRSGRRAASPVQYLGVGT
eukprot:scaffold4953_cov62-Phaeocystis_antarctica.AAC.4